MERKIEREISDKGQTEKWNEAQRKWEGVRVGVGRKREENTLLHKDKEGKKKKRANERASERARERQTDRERERKRERF